MKFLTRKRRSAPTIIIISLIDILIVLLIFLMVSTTFKQQPALKLALPESKQGKPGASENSPIVVTIAKQAPYLYLNTDPITVERLQNELMSRVAKNPQITLAIRADTDAPFGQIVKVMDVAKLAHVKSVSAFTKSNTGQ
jgi:biopolymer transport protein ExbD